MAIPAFIASANRILEEWRSPFGESSILEFFLDFIASEDVNLRLRSQALRLIGNTCADTGLRRLGLLMADL